MATLNPFDLSADEIPQKYLYYWFVTWCRLIYEAESNSDWAMWMTTMCDLVGADFNDLVIFPQEDWTFGDNRPRAEVMSCPAGNVVCVRGTMPGTQLVFEALQAQLVTRSPYPGQVGWAFSTYAAAVWEVIGLALAGNDWISIGHSLGGTIASLISIHGAYGCWTIGEPRNGNQAYANGRTDTFKIRVVNGDDVAPKIPPSTATFLDNPNTLGGWVFEQAWDPYTFSPGITFRHWGTPIYFWRYGGYSTGIGDSSTPVEITQYLVTAISTGQWEGPHAPGEHARRIRATINARYPLVAPDSQWPGVFELDNINYNLNLNPINVPFPWRVDSRAGEIAAGLLQQFLPQLIEPIFLRLGENNPEVIPFRCEGENES